MSGIEDNKRLVDEAQVSTVLVVEDEPNAREASRLYLSSCGYHVATAADAESALKKAETLQPDVVICDWRLGAGGDGVDVARELQQRYETPVIFVTAHPMDELLAVTADLDVISYFRKPFSLAALAETIAATA